ncbi:hypothetical protein TRFO_02886 [Tritrichomonas foetus]|uniref:ubiquitinyl hydrolase 1 n=1 Tax=Tritrichomonas foetus TaxID=1144522 RepID=A0A1J4KXD3_9EUKA|nr:hypothetical protein TRFO_02886 [Tritrichomonas foetus]|eukprot:OHT15544.1 hypothetical protein TRFO_02886 [Tritrichomonas foetus]
MTEMAKAESVRERYEIINKELSGHQYSPGETAYALSNKWFAKFKIAARNNNNDFNAKIDNRHLFDENGRVKQWLTEHDYVIIPQITWKRLIEWYPGGPEKPVPIIAESTSGNPFPDFILSTYQIYLAQETIDQNTKTVYISKYANIGQLKDLACKIFLIDNKETRLRDYFNQKTREILDDNRSIISYSFTNEPDLLLEVKNGNSWPDYSSKPKITRNNSPRYMAQISPGLVGIINIASQCYMASICQALGHCVPIHDFFFDTYKAQNVPPVTKEFMSLIKQMYTSTSNKNLTLSELQKAIGQKHDQFSLDGKFGLELQQDAHEFLVALLEFLIAQTSPNPKNSIQLCKLEEGSGINDTVGERNWNKLKELNQSPLYTKFYGLQYECYECTSCKHVQTVFSSFSVISIQLKSPKLKLQRVIWIPYDRTQEMVEVEICVTEGSAYQDFIQALKAERIQISGNTNVAFAVESQTTEKDVNNNNNNNNSSSYRFIIPKVVQGKLFAFEIPDKKKNYFLAQPLRSSDHCLLTFPFVCTLLQEDKDAAINIAKEKMKVLWKAPKVVEEGNEDTNQIYTNVEAIGNFTPNDQYSYLLNLIVEAVIAPDAESLVVDSKRYPADRCNNMHTVNLEDEIKNRSEFSLLEVEKECPNCHTKASPYMSTSIYHAPDILIFQFVLWDNNYNKIFANLSYPDVLDMTNYLRGDQAGETMKYELFAVVNHKGSTIYCGHYYTIARLNHTDKWYMFNDTDVHPVNKEESHSSLAYLLFYERVRE